MTYLGQDFILFDCEIIFGARNMGYPDSEVVTIVVLGINNKRVYYEYVYSIQVSAPHNCRRPQVMQEQDHQFPNKRELVHQIPSQFKVGTTQPISLYPVEHIVFHEVAYSSYKSILINTIVLVTATHSLDTEDN